MPVYQLEAEMPYSELQEWTSYFAQRPIGWREDDRTFKLLQVQGVKGNPADLFQSLVPLYQTRVDTGKGLDTKSLKNSALFQSMLNARGGVALKVEDE